MAVLRFALASAALAACSGTVTTRPAPPKVHRSHGDACDHVRDPSPPVSSPSPIPNICSTDADCKDDDNGRCDANFRGLGCTYDECYQDADCPQSSGATACICGEGLGNNRCLSGNCKTDSDCGAGGYCSPSFGSCGSYLGVVGYYCHTDADTCVEDADCSQGMGFPSYCAYSPASGHWSCSNSECVG